MPAIRVELQLSDGSFTSGMLRAGQSLSSFQKELARLDPNFRKVMGSGFGLVTATEKINTANRSLLATMRDVSIVTGGVALAFHTLTGTSSGLIGQIIKINADMERLRFQMEGLSRAADPIREAADTVEYLREKATKVPFSLKELSTTFVKLRTTGIDPMQGALKALTDGIAVFGGTDEQLHRVTLGIQQMSGKSVIQMEEMRQQLSESMPNAMQTMARSMGVSVQELVAAISTGRVQAKPALDAFYAELDRTYGGTAQRMMQTFSGQITQLQANLQRLATSEGMSAFVNVTLKNLVREFNAFLRSARAFAIADQIGNTFTSLANKVGILVQFLYQFREEFVLIGKALAAAVGFRMLAGLVGSIALAVNSARLSVAAFSGQMAIFSAAMNNVRIRANSGAGAILTMSAAAQTAGVGLRAAGSLMIAFAPWVAALGAVVAIAAGQFGLFKDEVKDAYEALRDFGAESRAEAERIINERQAQLEAALAAAARTAKRGGHAGRNAVAREAELNAELEALMAERERIMSNVGKREDAENTRRIEEEFADRTFAAKRAYRDEIVALEEKLKTELAKRGETGESLKQINDRYNNALNESRMRMHEAEIATLDEMRKAFEATFNTAAEGADKLSAENNLNVVVAMLEGTRQKLINLQNLTSGIDLGAEIENLEEKTRRGRREFENLTRDVKNLEAQLSGASGAVAEMLFRIERGDFGSIEEGGEAVRGLHEELAEAVVQKEILDKLMEGRKAVEADLERARQAAIEKRMELQERAAGRELSEGERIAQRLKQGYYEGLGPVSNIRKAIEDVVQTLNIQGDVLNRVGKTMQEHTFGDPTLTRIEMVSTAVRTLGAALAGLSDGSFNIGFGTGVTPNVGALSGGTKASMQQIMDLLMAEGVSRQAAAGMVGNFKVESGFNTSIVGDNGTSFGLAQWHKERWQGLRQYAQELGLSESDPRAQVKFALHEMARDFPGLLGRMNMAANPAEAASMFMREFEKPNLKYANEAGRRQAASDAFALDGGASPAIFDTGRVDALIAAREKETAAFLAAAEEVAGLERVNEAEEDRLARKDYLQKLIAAKTAASQDTADLGTNYQQLIEAIETGKLGSERSIDAGIYRELLAAAKELDQVEKDASERKKARTDATRQEIELERQRTDLNRQLAEAQARVKDPDYEGMSKDMVKLNEELEVYIENVRRAYGEDSAAYKQALDVKANMLRQQTRLEATERTAAMTRERRQIDEAAMSRLELARLEMSREMATVERVAAMKRAAGEREIEITRFVEEQKAAIQRKYEQQLNPIAARMREWKDLQGELVEKSATWMDSLASGVSGLITGTGDLRSVVNGMLNDVVNMMTRFMFAGLTGGKTSTAGAKIGGGFPGKPIPIAHTGGIIGSARLQTRTASPEIFRGAPRFHTGGVIGGTRLGPRERPIIGLEGEGVFTKEQMANLAPVDALNQRPMQINAPITVSGSGGTPEQNADLAKQIAREFEQSMKASVASEIRSAMRPGNVLNRR